MKERKDKSGKNNWFLDNKRELMFLAVGLVIGILVMYILWPDRVATLKSGEEIVVEVKGKQFTADELYNKLKSTSGLDQLIDMVDNYILHEKYDFEEEAENFAKEQSETIYTTYQNYYGYTKEDFLGANGFESEKDFLDYLNNEYYYQEYYKEYVSGTITDKEIEEYYKANVFGEKQVYIFTANTEDNDLENVRKYLKNGKTFDQIKKKYPKVTATTVDAMKYTDTDSYSETILSTVAATKKGSYSKVFQDDTLGYAVVYVVDEKETPKLEDVTDEVVSLLVSKKQSGDEKLYYQAFIQLRKDYGIKFSDTVMEDTYKKLVKNYE